MNRFNAQIKWKLIECEKEEEKISQFLWKNNFVGSWSEQEEAENLIGEKFREKEI